MAPAILNGVSGAIIALYALPGFVGHPGASDNFNEASLVVSSFVTTDAGVQASAGVPPQLELMSPIGTFNFS